MNVKIKMLTLKAGPSGVFPAGTVLDVGGDEARELVNGGFAEVVPVKPEPVAEPEPTFAEAVETVEAAMTEPEETTAMPAAKPRGRKRK